MTRISNRQIIIGAIGTGLVVLALLLSIFPASPAHHETVVGTVVSVQNTLFVVKQDFASSCVIRFDGFSGMDWLPVYSGQRVEIDYVPVLKPDGLCRGSLQGFKEVLTSVGFAEPKEKKQR